MSMAPVAAACSAKSSGATKSATQSIASPGPAMKPSSDIALFTTTLPFPALVSLNLFLRRSLGCSRDPFRRLLGRDYGIPRRGGVRFESFGAAPSRAAPKETQCRRHNSAPHDQVVGSQVY